MTRRRCRFCQTPLLFLKTETGSVIPLDLRAPVYEIATDMMGEKIARPAEGFHVSHFSTCPKANEFSGGKRKLI